jgi:AAA family ATP:ADP antiporter
LKAKKTLDRLLSVFAPVQPGEGATAFLLMMNVFFLMTAYYIIKPVRESLILAGAGPEIKSYAGAAGALAFLVLVPVYGKFASRLNRICLINGVTAFFASNLILFYVLGRLNISFGIVFFLWVGLFNLMLVAQFWAFANDVYTHEQGKRLFAIVGIGSALGAIFGAEVAGRLFEPLGPYPMMLVTAALLIGCMILTNWVHRREKHIVVSQHADEPLNHNGSFQLVLTQRYLFLIALLILLSNLVNTTGEFILGKSVAEHAKAVSNLSAGVSAEEYIGKFYAGFFFWVNLAGAGLQMFVVSRIMKRIGIGPALFFLPVIALGSYSLLAIAPLLSIIRAVKIAENGTDYSIQNTARHALFLRTSREEKYKAKTAIDSFFWRAGDALSAVIVFAGTSFAFSLRGFAITNAVMTIVWLAVVIGIVRHRASWGDSEPETQPIVPRIQAYGRGDLMMPQAEPIPSGTNDSVEIRRPEPTTTFWQWSCPDPEEQRSPAEDVHKGPGSGRFPLSS